ncbi:acyltransferase domain-containing protein [Paenibacillus sp. OV219]|uniref:acyltransferase domain-containing protein n=1 Tax=Paenibacillus sp. OV219 TaxID=1884377 RepID=UPI0008C7A969|nr:acyltransferase domain-containing protein [Paenibacillus sp. OV219]SEO54391.1 hypothetical protein SAMN05518847_108213 [Paenibacillus sp. OV219]
MVGHATRQQLAEPLWFLQEAELTAANEWLQLPADALRALTAAAAEIRADEALCKLAQEGRALLFPEDASGADTEDASGAGSGADAHAAGVSPYRAEVSDWIKRTGNKAAQFIPLVLFSGLPRTIEQYKHYGIPKEVLVHTLSDLKLWMEHYYRKHGSWGTDIMWMHHHLTFQLFRLGRLQFCWSRFNGHMVVLRNTKTSEVVVMAEGGIRFRRDGLIDGTSGRFESSDNGGGVWQSELLLEEAAIRGHRINADGYASQAQTTLSPREDWDIILRDGDSVLDIHVAADGKLDIRESGESLREASRFFAQYFPEVGFRAYACTSWLLDSQFRKLLAPTQNIVQFLNGFHLYPSANDGTEGLRRIFDGQLYADWGDAPQDTSLRRIVRQHMMDGHSLRDMGGVILPDDAVWQ